MQPILLHAAWIFPVSEPPIAAGTVECDAAGRIVAVHRGSLPGAVDLDNAAIVPGFVNAHTHLEFSDLNEPLCPALPFTEWIRRLIQNRWQRADRTAAIRQGLAESQRAGTAAVGEVATADWTEGPLPDDPITVVFRELIGLASLSVKEQIAEARLFLQGASADKSATVLRGLSPHAPYSVHPQLLEEAVALSREFRSPLTMHLAETPAEIELLRQGTGDFVGMLKGLGAWTEDVFASRTRPLDFLHILEKADRVIVAHGNYLDDEEIAFLAARPNFAVAFCPRTHAFFEHRDHPWQKIVAQGGRVAIGTDGRCSNPDLSVWNELLFLRRQFPDFPPEHLLTMGTLSGAEALGLDARIGTIEVGKEARLAVIRLGTPCSESAYADLFHSASRVVPR
jgi:cytosine/adenosine deaminase-related metal-dependent hydrolase